MANGKVGAPKGNQNGAKGRRWFEAIDKALKQYVDKKRKIEAGQALDRIAKIVVKEALEGSFWAIEEIADRLDGKAAQSLHLTAEITDVRELSDEQLFEQLERARRAARTVDAPSSTPESSGVH